MPSGRIYVIYTYFYPLADQTGKSDATTNLTHLTVSTNPILDFFLSPGFPLTLRLENPIQESLASVSSFGHPVVDTTGAIGQG